jgi:hypothetical protein
MDIYERLTFTPLVIVNNSAIGSSDLTYANEFNRKVKEYFLYRLNDYGLEVENIKPESYCIPQSVATYRINQAFENYIKKEGITKYTNQAIYINVHANNLRNSWGNVENEVAVYYRSSDLNESIINTLRRNLGLISVKKRNFKNIIPVSLEVEINYMDTNKTNYIKIINEIVFAYLLALGISREALLFYKESSQLKDTIKALEERIVELETTKEE